MIYKKLDTELTELGAIHTVSEIKQQPDTWVKTFKLIQEQKDEIDKFIANVTDKEDFMIVLSGAGTSEFVGNSLVDYFQAAYSNKIESIATTRIVSNPKQYFNKDKTTLLINFARSGNSPESLAAVEYAEEICDDLYHMVITCNKEGKLITDSNLGERQYNIVLPEETNDKSLAMTSSFTNMTLAAYLVLSKEVDEVEVMHAVNVAREFLTDKYTKVEEMLGKKEYGRYVFLGSNSLKGIAQESALKCLELTSGGRPTLFDTTLGFRHGPKSFLNDETLTVVFASSNPYTYKYDLDLIESLPGDVLVVGQENVKDLETESIVFSGIVNDAIFGIVHIMIGQTIGVLSSMQEGLKPDTPSPSGLITRVVTGVTIHPLD